MEWEGIWELGRLSINSNLSTSIIGLGGTLSMGDIAVYVTCHFLIFHLTIRIERKWVSNL